jgi:hypothetical protein
MRPVVCADFFDAPFPSGFSYSRSAVTLREILISAYSALSGVPVILSHGKTRRIGGNAPD